MQCLEHDLVGPTRRCREVSLQDRDGPSRVGVGELELCLLYTSLSKSCGIEVLARAVELTTQLQGKLFSDATQRLVAEVGALPSLPASLMAVDACLLYTSRCV